MRETINSNKYVQVAIFVLAVLLSAFMLVRFFEQIPTEGTETRLAIDLNHFSIKDGHIIYHMDRGLRIAPWSVIPLLPLGFLSERAAWGMLVYINMIALILSVPHAEKKWHYWLAILLLVTSFPALRTSIDGNYEILITIGALLIVWGYNRHNPFILAFGILLITAKPQSAFLILLILTGYMLQAWPWDKIAISTGLVLLVVIPMFIYRGMDWLEAIRTNIGTGDIIDISLNAALVRTGVVPEGIRWLIRISVGIAALYIVVVGNRNLNREKAGFLIATALLVGPYAAGNSTLSVFTVGVIPLFLTSPKIGGFLILMMNGMYLFRGDFRYNNESYFLTTWLLLTWGILAWRVYQFEVIQPQPLQPTENAIAA